jgi:hypothetical protein
MTDDQKISWKQVSTGDAFDPVDPGNNFGNPANPGKL